jgi:TetR/AcrR family transcriptional repressor of nem operon
MGRPRGFDETEVIRSAVLLFADRAYDGVSVDDLVNELGVHRNSLYQTFGSKRGLYLAALRHYVQHDLAELLARISTTGSPAAAVQEAVTRRPGEAGLDLLLMAAVERAPEDATVATEVAAALTALDESLNPPVPTTPTPGSPVNEATSAATLLGLRLRARITS